jgi:hypothetical protein
MHLPKYSFVLRSLAVFLLCGVLAACLGRRDKGDELLKTTDIPQSYDLVLHADKDGQFDLDGATLASEDLRGHLRYLEEQHQVVKTVLLKPGEKYKIKGTHINELAKIGYQLKFRAFIDADGDGKVSEVRARAVEN